MTTAAYPAAPRMARDLTLGIKRMADISLSLLGLLCIWPLFVLIALAVATTSPGGVFYVQTRVGKDGRPFRMMKFRSMFQDADRRRNEVELLSDREGVCLKVRHDPRVTPVGRFLRRTSLDELPQLINVLRGQMSLVGPRPALIAEVNAFPSHAHLRHSVRPGITGLWQVSGRADIGFDEMIALDLAYVRNLSVQMDTSILLRTVGAVLSGKGAY